MTKEISWDEAEKRLDNMKGGEMYNAKIVSECFMFIGITTIYRIEYIYGGWIRNVTGVVHCSNHDKYNEEFGKQLAKTKAHEAYWHEVKKLQIAETYKPEWKKKQKMSFEGEYIKGGIYPIKDYDRVVKEAARKFDKGKPIKVTIEEI